MERKEKAVKLFNQGYNCAQAVMLAFSDCLDIDEKTIQKITSSFGGGVSIAFFEPRDYCVVFVIQKKRLPPPLPEGRER